MNISKVITFGQGGFDPAGRETDIPHPVNTPPVYDSLLNCDPLTGTISFRWAVGGTPANTACGLGRLGISVMFVGKMADDVFGRFFADTLKANRVDTSELRFDETTRTGVSFDSGALEKTGLLFSKPPAAYHLIRKDEISPHYFQKNAIFLFGAVTLSRDPAREATFFAADLAIEKGLLVAFDPNLRPGMWPSIEEAREMIKRSLKKANLVKLSLNEFRIISGSEEIEKINQLRLEYDIDLLIITLGAKGAFYCNRCNQGLVKSKRVKVLDITGAGDGFFAALLYKIIQLNSADSISLSNLTKEQLVKITEFANAAGGLTTTKLGVVPALPTIEEINAFLKKGNS